MARRTAPQRRHSTRPCRTGATIPGAECETMV